MTPSSSNKRKGCVVFVQSKLRPGSVRFLLVQQAEGYVRFALFMFTTDQAVLRTHVESTAVGSRCGV